MNRNKYIIGGVLMAGIAATVAVTTGTMDEHKDKVAEIAIVEVEQAISVPVTPDQDQPALVTSAAQIVSLVQGTIGSYTADHPDLYEERAPMTVQQRNRLRDVFTQSASSTIPVQGITRTTLPDFMRAFQNAVAATLAEDDVLKDLDEKARAQLNTIFFDPNFKQGKYQSLYNYLENNMP